MRITRFVVAMLGLVGCAEPAEEFVQPGLDDPSARQWVKAGSWYPESPRELDEDVDALLADIDAEPQRAVAVLTPHASLRFSGPTAAEVYARLEVPSKLILLAPDHWGNGEHIAGWGGGPWLVPGHAIGIAEDLMAQLHERLPDLTPDRDAFSHHESEMQLPFLQSAHPDTLIAPIAIFDNSRKHFDAFDVPRIEQWGQVVADIVREHEAAGEEVLILATTDLSHHEPIADVDVKDARQMELIAALDVQGLYDYVTTENITICGEIPTAIMMSALRELGHTSIDTLKRGHSLHANPDDTDVIGYPAMAVWK